jgi:hypothetical protein
MPRQWLHRILRSHAPAGLLSRDCLGAIVSCPDGARSFKILRVPRLPQRGYLGLFSAPGTSILLGLPSFPTWILSQASIAKPKSRLVALEV